MHAERHLSTIDSASAPVNHALVKESGSRGWLWMTVLMCLCAVLVSSYFNDPHAVSTPFSA